MIRGSLLCFVIILICATGVPQSIVPVSLDKRIQLSSQIVEGRVINQHSYWNTDNTLILTSSEVELNTVFKGVIAPRITIVTEGGQVGNEMLTVEPELELHVGDVGVFFLEGTYKSNHPSAAFIPVAASQGFIRYDLTDKIASDIFHKYSGIPGSVQQTMFIATGMKYLIKPLEDEPVVQHALLAPVITAFLPSTISAGTFSDLIITGANFGASYSASAKVEFKNANDGGATFIAAPASHIVSWSDLQIVVKVPRSAGSGGIRVTNTAGEPTISALIITIPFSQLNTVDGTTFYEPHLLNNQSGGFRMIYSTSTANSGINFNTHTNAKARFESAVQTWMCNTGFNVAVSGTTSIAAAAFDSVNLVAFDNALTPLAAGVLALTYYWFGRCDPPPQSMVRHIDIIFKRDGTDGASWYFGENSAGLPPGSFDFQTSALHELGHAHALGHVIAPGTVMHFALPPGVANRTLASGEVDGGGYVMSNSITFNSCEETGMIAVNCLAAPVADFASSRVLLCNWPGEVNFFDASSGQITSWNWSFPGGSPSSSFVRNPTVTYTSQGSYSVTLTTSNGFGSDTETKTDFIITGGLTPPTNIDFEGVFPGMNIIIQNPDGLIKWRSLSVTGRSGSATKVAYMDHFDYSPNNGELDDIIIPSQYIHSTGINISFDLSYARYGSANFERLQVLVSTDCGSTFPTIVYDKSGSNVSGNTLSTVPESVTEFFPTQASHWRRETISLNAYAGQAVLLKFRTFNGWGNNLYLDNITVASQAICTGPNVWTGALSTAWENAGNWSCGTVPDNTTDVQINSGTVIVNSNRFCRSLVVQPAVTFTVNAGFNLTVAH